MADCDAAKEEEISITEDLVRSPMHKQALTSSIDFDGLLNPPLELHENLSKGNGGQAWQAGKVLTKYLLRKKRDDLKHCSILELGAGSGLVGLSIAAGCQTLQIVHITDQRPMLDLMQRNIALNDLQDKVAASVYDWAGTRPPTVPAHPDVVFAADCVYFEPAFPLLQQTLQELIGPDTTCYFCFKKRHRADLHFMEVVKKSFLVEDIADDPDRDVYARENILLCTIRKKAER